MPKSTSTVFAGVPWPDDRAGPQRADLPRSWRGSSSRQRSAIRNWVAQAERDAGAAPTG